LARLLEQNIGEAQDSEIFEKMYFLCVFKVFEHDEDILKEVLDEM
jgi:hypothetical protein